MKTICLTLSFAAALCLAPACSSVKYDDPDRAETLTIDFGSTDLQTLANAMTNSFLQSPALQFLDQSGKGDDKRIIMYVGKVENRTSEHIDTQGITDSIRVKLLQSGRFRFTADDAGQDQIGDQVRFQQGSGRVDPAQARAFGKQIGADVIMYGTLRSIEKGRGRSIETGGTKKEDVYYQFVLNAVNIDTGEIMWADEKDIRKVERRGLFG
ncbi:MAG: penicillin-binding protein activator LpoB [Planctomycetaceae bacterium]|nr:penicillin-binding protein activator LpoB [Planctomycetaceae bacterium]